MQVTHHHYHILGDREDVRTILHALEQLSIMEIPAGLGEPALNVAIHAAVALMDARGQTRFWMVLECMPGQWSAILLDTRIGVGVPFGLGDVN